MGKKDILPVTLAAVVVCLLLVLDAKADDRLDRIQAAFNSGDVLGAQQDFSRDLSAARSAAEMANLVSTSNLMEATKDAEIMPGLFAANVNVDGVPLIWLYEVKDNQITYFGYRKAISFGGAELGQGLDIASTGIGIGFFDAVEANPIGLAALPIKAGATYQTRFMPFADCVPWRTSLDVFGVAPGVANIATLLFKIAEIKVSLGIAALVAVARWDAANEAAVFECAQFALEAI